MKPLSITPRYLVNCCIQMNLWTASEWKAARKKSPELVPSEYTVRKYFTDFEKLFEIAKAESIRQRFDKVVVMRGELGRWPTMEELRQGNLHLDEYFELFESKRNFERFLERCYRSYLSRVT